MDAKEFLRRGMLAYVIEDPISCFIRGRAQLNA